jgi:hypothetical protein
MPENGATCSLFWSAGARKEKVMESAAEILKKSYEDKSPRSTKTLSNDEIPPDSAAANGLGVTNALFAAVWGM